MPNALKTAIHQWVPRPIVNFVWNFASDVKDLPVRLSASKPLPWRVIHNVGGGDFHTQGARLCAMFARAVDLKADQHILDIGCGAGRLAFHLADQLGPYGRYTGFDIAEAGLSFARRHVAGAAKFDFIHADLANPEYRSAGEQAEQYRFPAEAGDVDAAVSTSVFTHIDAATAKAYIDEIGRVLKPGGRAYLTAFLLDEAVKARVKAGEAQLAMQALDAISWAADPRYPERAIGFERAAFMAWCQGARLNLRGEISPGWWSRSDQDGEFQDQIVLEKC